MKFLIILIPFLLSGCGTVVQHVVETKPEVTVEEIKAVSAAPLPVFSIDQESIATSGTSSSPEIVQMQDTGLTTIDPIETKIVKPKQKRFIDKVTDTVMSAAEAATVSKKETITYSETGEIKSKVVEVNESSILENLTKLVGFLSATLGLYIGVKKYKSSTPETA